MQRRRFQANDADDSKKLKWGNEEISEINRQIMDIKLMPKLEELEDSDLGIDELQKVLPDTWKNISWVIVHAIQVLAETTRISRREIEPIRQYSIEGK